MSASGNMIPQSTSRIRPSTSMQQQLRPISPSPPKKTMRTESLIADRRYHRPRAPTRRSDWRQGTIGNDGGVARSGVGVVQQLRRYPIKSMLGEELTRAELTARG